MWELGGCLVSPIAILEAEFPVFLHVMRRIRETYAVLLWCLSSSLHPTWLPALRMQGFGCLMSVITQEKLLATLWAICTTSIWQYRCHCCSRPDMEIGSCSAPSVLSRFPWAAPRVALEVTGTDCPPASCREGQGCTGTWNRVEASSQALLTQRATSKDKCFSGIPVTNILHSLLLSAVETLGAFPPSLFPPHPSIPVPFQPLGFAMSAAIPKCSKVISTLLPLTQRPRYPALPESISPFLGDFIPMGYRYFYKWQKQCCGNWGKKHVLPASAGMCIQTVHTELVRKLW